MTVFHDRREAGRCLAAELKSYAHHPNAIILALPRGGAPIAYEIAKSLGLPWDVFIVRKLGVPGQEELAMGAIASGGEVVFNEDILKACRIEQEDIEAVILAEQEEINRRERIYRGDRPFPILKNRVVILVDDGIATGATMRAAIRALRQQKPLAIVVAVPVASSSSCQEISALVDEFFCPLQPDYFYAVGAHYEKFPQVKDQEVTELLTNKILNDPL
jgi:predicted phosphoribosyltransferase